MSKNKLSTGQEKWACISPEFTDELVKKWKEAGFSYENCKEWMDIVQPSVVAIEIHNIDFYEWLVKEKDLNPEAVLNYYDYGTLIKEYEGYNLDSDSSSGSSTASQPESIYKTINPEAKPVVLDPKTLIPLDWDKLATKTLAEWKDEKVIDDDIEKTLQESGLAKEDTKYTLAQLEQISKQINRIKKSKSFINYNYFITPTCYYNRNQTGFPLLED